MKTHYLIIVAAIAITLTGMAAPPHFQGAKQSTGSVATRQDYEKYNHARHGGGNDRHGRDDYKHGRDKDRHDYHPRKHHDSHRGYGHVRNGYWTHREVRCWIEPRYERIWQPASFTWHYDSCRGGWFQLQIGGGSYVTTCIPGYWGTRTERIWVPHR